MNVFLLLSRKLQEGEIGEPWFLACYHYTTDPLMGQPGFEPGPLVPITMNKTLLLPSKFKEQTLTGYSLLTTELKRISSEHSFYLHSMKAIRIKSITFRCSSAGDALLAKEPPPYLLCV